MAGQREQIEEVTRRAMLGRDRLTARQVRELEDILAEAARQVRDELRRFEEVAPLGSGQAVRLAQLEALKENISRIAQSLSEGLKGLAPEHARQAFEQGIRDGIGDAIRIGLPEYAGLKSKEADALASAVFSQVDREALEFLVRYRLVLMGDVAEEVERELKRRIASGIASGKSTPEIVRDVGKVIRDEEKFRQAGRTVFKSAQQRLRLICRTETNRAHNAGRVRFYEQAGVKKVEWLSTLDSRTCPECASRHSQTFALNGFTPPPLHPRCRCTVVPK